MQFTRLDNPVWHAPSGRHRHFAEVCGAARRLYEAMGFSVRATLPMGRLEKIG